MIDFVSTHPDAHPQTVACARLLAAVIAQAVDDASSSKSTIAESSAAVDWLFDETSTFAKYAYLIGADAQAMRGAMLAPHEAAELQPLHNKFDESRRRKLRQNHAVWLKHKTLEQKNK